MSTTAPRHVPLSLSLGNIGARPAEHLHAGLQRSVMLSLLGTMPPWRIVTPRVYRLPPPRHRHVCFVYARRLLH